MSTYIIAGKECAFPGIPHSTLELYGPRQDTHLAMWRPTASEDGLFIRVYLGMLYRIKSIDRLTIFDLDGGVTSALFDYAAPTSRILDDLTNYLRILFGTAQLVKCPWRIATNTTMRHELDIYYKMEEEIIEMYRDVAGSGRSLPKNATHALLELISQERDTTVSACAATDGDTSATAAARDALRAHMDARKPLKAYGTLAGSMTGYRFRIPPSVNKVINSNGNQYPIPANCQP